MGPHGQPYRQNAQADRHPQEKRIKRQVHKVPRQHRDGAGENGGQGKPRGIFPLSHSPPHMGRKTTAPRSPMDRKPKSLIMAPGTKMATTAAAIRITRMVPRVTRRLVRDCFIRLLFRANRSVTRMEAIPKASPEPPPTTVINRCPAPPRPGVGA